MREVMALNKRLVVQLKLERDARNKAAAGRSQTNRKVPLQPRRR